MIVDDQAFNLFAIESQLEFIGVSVVKATSGERAVEALQKRLAELANGTKRDLFKLILLDYNMGDLNGPETARTMQRKFAEFRAINPQVVCRMPYMCCLSAFTASEARQIALDSGMDQYVQKPISFDRLQALIKQTAAI